MKSKTHLVMTTALVSSALVAYASSGFSQSNADPRRYEAISTLETEEESSTEIHPSYYLPQRYVPSPSRRLKPLPKMPAPLISSDAEVGSTPDVRVNYGESLDQPPMFHLSPKSASPALAKQTEEDDASNIATNNISEKKRTSVRVALKAPKQPSGISTVDDGKIAAAEALKVPTPKTNYTYDPATALSSLQQSDRKDEYETAQILYPSKEATPEEAITSAPRKAVTIAKPGTKQARPKEMDNNKPYGLFDYLGDALSGEDDHPAKVIGPEPSDAKIILHSPKVATKKVAYKEAPALPAPSDPVLPSLAPLGVPTVKTAHIETPPTAVPLPEEVKLVKEITPVAAHVVSNMTTIPPEPVTEDGKEYLDAEARRILSRIPRGLDSPPTQSIPKATVDRYDPDVEGLLGDEEGEEEQDVRSHESMGVAIEVRRPMLDVNVELQNAYEALLGGQPQIAIQIYKDILHHSSRQQDALFGLATTYHRMGNTELARPFYEKLLRLNPAHRDGLANYLSLIAQDAPDEAVRQLERLASANPDFGPIPAQLGALYDRMGKKDHALNALIRAVRIAPENIAYVYNLAVLYDKYGMVADATILYNQLLAASRAGVEIPTDPRSLQERVIFINKQPAHG